MSDNTDKHFDFKVDLDGKALSRDEILLAHQQLKTKFLSSLSFIIAMVVLGAGVTYRAITLDYDKELELFNLSLYIGIWFGLFTGFMIDGSFKRKLQMALVAVIISSAASLFLSMLVTLFVGHLTVWISSLNILGSALGCMWVLTRYDEVIKGLESVKTVNEKQFYYIRKASANFKQLYQFSEKIIAQGRPPLVGEYWAYRDWIREKAANNKKQ